MGGSMKITPRDEELFKLICRHNLLSTNQIHRQIFPQLKLTTVMRRLKKLAKAGHVIRLGKLYSGMSVWGISQAANDRSTGFFSSSRTNLHTLEHDVTVSEIHLLIESITPIKEWFDNRHMRSASVNALFKKDFSQHYYREFKKDDLFPDSLFLATINGKPKSFALEVEISLKANSRYTDLTDLYAGRNPPKFIYYVVRDEKIRNAVVAASEQYSVVKERLIYSFLDDLLANKGDAQVYTWNGKTTLLKDYFSPKSGVPEPAPLDDHPVDKQKTLLEDNW
jgi:hypothetical protein